VNKSAIAYSTRRIVRLKLPLKLIQNLSVAAISDPLTSRTRGRVMGDYHVLFFNNLVNSYGKPFKCSAKDAGEASEKAKREFERLEHVPNWKYHAQFLEVESRDIVRK
jgi:hypothetical protein